MKKILKLVLLFTVLMTNDIIFSQNSKVSYAEALCTSGGKNGFNYQVKFRCRYTLDGDHVLLYVIPDEVYNISYYHNGKYYNDLSFLSKYANEYKKPLKYFVDGRLYTIIVSANYNINHKRISDITWNGSFGNKAVGDKLLDREIDDIKKWLNDSRGWESHATVVIHSIEFYKQDYREKITEEYFDRYLEDQKKSKKIEELKGKIASTEDKEKKIELLQELKEYSDDDYEIDQEIEKLKTSIQEKNEVIENDEKSNKNNNAENNKDDNTSKSHSNQSTYKQEKIENQKSAFQKQIEYDERIRELDKKNAETAALNTTTTLSALYLLGGVVYSNYGRVKSSQIFTGKNIKSNLDIGFTSSYQPLLFAKDYSSYNYYLDEYVTNNNTTLDTPFYLNLRIGGQLGYETEKYGGYGLASLQAGVHPTLSGTNINYSFGGRIFGGLKNIKIFGEYQYGYRDYNNKNNISSEENGIGKTNYNYERLNYGLKLSWYGSPKKPARNHINIGIIEERFNKLGDNISKQGIDIQTPFVFSNESLYNADVYVGYSFEWRHDHHGLLFVEVFPNYPATGIKGGVFDDSFKRNGNVFVQVGFIRSFGGYSKFQR